MRTAVAYLLTFVLFTLLTQVPKDHKLEASRQKNKAKWLMPVAEPIHGSLMIVIVNGTLLCTPRVPLKRGSRPQRRVPLRELSVNQFELFTGLK